jgi:hypothetical protein
MTIDLRIIALDMITRDDISILLATRDAIELADLLIAIMPDSLITVLTDHLEIDDDLEFEFMIGDLRREIESMILSPMNH